MGITKRLAAVRIRPNVLITPLVFLRRLHYTEANKMAWTAGIEPTTCGLEDRCSIQLSYAHINCRR